MRFNRETAGKLATVFIALFFVVSFQSQLMDTPIEPQSIEEKLIGKWYGGGEDIDDKDKGYMIFDDEGGAILEINGQIIGGPDFEMEGISLELAYEIDEDYSPTHLDFIISADGTEAARMKGLIIFVNDDTFRMNISTEPGTPRPKVFEEGDIARFERVK